MSQPAWKAKRLKESEGTYRHVQLVKENRRLKTCVIQTSHCAIKSRVGLDFLELLYDALRF